jgi:hypothetical protein
MGPKPDGVAGPDAAGMNATHLISLASPQHEFVTGTRVRGFVIGLVGGILASVGLTIGVVFLVAGSGDSADAATLGDVGVAALAAGFASLVLAVAGAWHGRRRTRAEAAARTDRATAVVTAASLRLHSRVGNRHPLRLTVRFRAGLGTDEERTRTLYVHPTTQVQVGQLIEVSFAPGEPANFVPLVP